MRVLIVGAGIAGTTLAVLLAEAGFECELFERAPASGGGAALAIASNGLAVLEAAGVLPALDNVSVLAGDWAFKNEAGGTLACIPDARRGTPYQTRFVSRPLLQSVLEGRLRELGVAVQFGKRLQSITDVPGNRVVAHFEDGSEAEGDCLIGADGVGSQVRKLICPETPGPAYSGLLAVIGFCPCAIPESVIARSEQRVHLVFGRNSFFEHVDILTPEGPRTVWWSTVETAMPSREAIAAEDIAVVRRRMLALHHGWAQPVPQLIGSTTKVVQLPIQEIRHVPRWSQGRVLILGDAAHATGPHSGQAASMALEDAMLLAQLMAAAPKGALHQPEVLQPVFHALEAERLKRLRRVLAISLRAAGRKQEMGKLSYWWMQQQMRIRVPLGSRRSKSWLLDHRFSGTIGD